MRINYILTLFQIHGELNMEIIKWIIISLIGLYLWARLVDWSVRSVSKNENRTDESENRTIRSE